MGVFQYNPDKIAPEEPIMADTFLAHALIPWYTTNEGVADIRDARTA